MAQREIRLSAREPPTAEGYTATVFTELPKLLDGPGVGQGAITGIFTVWSTATTIMSQSSAATIPPLTRSVSRKHAEIGRSGVLASDPARAASSYADMEELTRLGTYRAGSSAEVDKAIKLHEPLKAFLRQAKDEFSDLGNGYRQPEQIVGRLETER